MATQAGAAFASTFTFTDAAPAPPARLRRSRSVAINGHGGAAPFTFGNAGAFALAAPSTAAKPLGANPFAIAAAAAAAGRGDGRGTTAPSSLAGVNMKPDGSLDTTSIAEAEAALRTGRCTGLTTGPHGAQWGDGEFVRLAAALVAGRPGGGGGCPALTKLELTGNACGDAGAAALAGAIEAGACPALEKLALYHNKIGDSGGRRLAEAAESRKCPRLRELELIGNVGITDFSVYGRISRVMALALAPAASGPEFYYISKTSPAKARLRPQISRRA